MLNNDANSTPSTNNEQSRHPPPQLRPLQLHRQRPSTSKLAISITGLVSPSSSSAPLPSASVSSSSSSERPPILTDPPTHPHSGGSGLEKNQNDDDAKYTNALELNRIRTIQVTNNNSTPRGEGKLHTIQVSAKNTNSRPNSPSHQPQPRNPTHHSTHSSSSSMSGVGGNPSGGVPTGGTPVVVAASNVRPSQRNLHATGSQTVHPNEARRDDRVFSLKNGVREFPNDAKGKQPVYANSSNCVITSKYTLLTFLPINLFEQFCNLANLYFLLVGIFQIVPQFSTTNGNPTMYQPLAFIVFVSACRAAKEDWDKHKADAGRNGFKYKVLQDGEFVERESGDIKVGEIVKVEQNNMIPTDMLFLGSSLAKGHCFIDKSNLNGETHLEVMNSMVQTRPLCKDAASMSKLNLTIQYEPPNKRFDSFRGTIVLDSPSEGKVEYNVDGKPLIMRETNLRNCDYIYGLVVYTGNDTKIQRSNLEGEKPKTKVSYIMRKVNKYLAYMLILQTILCVVGGILGGLFREGLTKNMWFLLFVSPQDRAPGGPLTGVYAFFSWFILLSQMVPISLIVSSEMVKFIQSIFIEKDLQLYYEKLNKPTKCNSSTIHEDLGLVDFIFSDKTGTLTQNKMEFRYLYLSVGEFGSKETDIAKSVKTRQQQLADKQAGRPVSTNTLPWSKMIKPHLALKDPRIDKEDNCFHAGWFADNCWRSPQTEDDSADEDIPLIKNEFTDEERDALWQRLYGRPPAGETPEETAHRRGVLRRYMVHMALSNTVKPYDDEGEIKFQAESAEELAMTQWARKCGFFKKQINPTVLEITEYDEDLKPKPEKVIETYNHVATFGFTSKRARVTVIYQRVDGDKKCHVMMKGQDTVALPLISLGDVDEDELLEQLKNMSTFGLRTLVCGYGELESSWWQQRAQRYQEIISRDTTPASEGHPEKCKKGECEKCEQHEFFEAMEKEADLKYLGVMGMEDQLQLLVPECIGDCIRGGIKVWMITGDKLETAKNIGLACNLIDPDMIPSFASADIDECVKEFQRSRLVEITGAWANMAQNDEDLGKIFDVFDKNNNGTLNLDELHFILTSLRCNLTPEKLKSIITENSPDRNGEPSINRDGFMKMMKSTQMSRFDAVWFDIEEGIKTWNAISNHDQYPVSLLIDRAAFQVLFPGKAGATPTQADLQALGPNVTLKKLNILREMFFQLAGRAKSVVFARAEPAMKKRMVTEIQARIEGAITLAIGDGANDTDMITAAHIGVGIAGVEGTAATNSADYAIGTFRMLHRLLFVHGFYSYQRTSKLVVFIFYKASLVAVMMFLFGFFSAMSGQQFFADAPYQLYNVMYTALPIMAVAILDKMLPADFLQDNPSLYALQKHTAFDAMIFSGWIFRAFLHGCVLFFIPYGAFGVENINQSEGRADGIWYFSTTAYYCTVMTPTLLIIFDMSNITFLNWLALLSSVSSLFVVTWIMNYLTSIVPDLDGVINTMYENASFWLVLIVTVGICQVLELIWRAFMRETYPTIVQIAQEIVRMPPEEQKVALEPGRFLPPTATPVKEQTNTQAVNEDIEIEYSQSYANSVEHSRRGSRVGIAKSGSFANGMESSRGRDKLKNNMVRAMLRFRNMTGAQFDSAAQAQLQQHDKFKSSDEPSPNGSASTPKHANSTHSGLGSTSASSSQPQQSSHYTVQSASPSAPQVTSGHELGSTSNNGNSLNVSIALLDKYGGNANSSHQQGDEYKMSQVSPSGGEEEPKVHDRRLL